MRVLLTACPQYGHFFPLVPLAWALRVAGHEVRVAVPEQFTATVAASGLPPVAVGGVLRTRDIMGVGDRSLLDRWSTDPAGMQTIGVRTVSRFARHLTEPIVEFCRAWRPDLIVHPNLEFAGPIAAAVMGIPHAVVSVGVALPQRALDAAAEELDPLYRAWGQTGGTLAPAVRLDLWPPSLQLPGTPVATTMRHVPYAGSGVGPAWLYEPVKAPRTCITLGSIVPKTGGTEVIGPVLQALDSLEHDIVIVLPDDEARAVAEGAVGRLPSRTRVATACGGPWLPLNLVAPSCDLVVHHGGAGTTLTSLAYGRPQLVLPHMADQFTTADQLARQGAARVIQPATAQATAVAESVVALLGSVDYTHAAQRLRAEIGQQPSPPDVVCHLERLVFDK